MATIDGNGQNGDKTNVAAAGADLAAAAEAAPRAASIEMPPSAKPPNAAWATLVTGEKYLPGLVVFAKSLLRGSAKHERSQYPLVAMITTDVSEEAIQILERDADCTIRRVERLDPGHSRGSENLAFAHFQDVWTKLRAFDLEEYDRVVMVDSDMLVLQNMDELMDLPLPTNHIMATFACTCNPLKKSTYPKEWIPENCAYTNQTHPHHARQGMEISPDSRPTYHLLNSGLVILTPSHTVMKDMEYHIRNDKEIETFKFPDQDFLAAYFRNRFVPIPYIYNALKKLRSIHPQLWRDEEIKNIHYILDKPWTSSPNTDKSDAVTHRWWWDVYRAEPSWPEVVTRYVTEPSS